MFLLAGCESKPYQVTADGVTVSVSDAADGASRMVRLQVMSDRVVRVSATPDKAFHDRPSLMVLPDARHETAFAVSDAGDNIVLKTSAMIVTVSKADGTVAFADAGGNIYTRESGSPEFQPVQVDGDRGFTTVNRFETTPTEGLYGLGQHQSDQWNYNGLDEELYQYNTRISMPFVISSKSYGILWDSYSQGRFGNTEPYGQLNRVFELFDRDGNPGGLTGVYQSRVGRRPFGGAAGSSDGTLVRTEDSIYYVNSEMIANLPPLGDKVTYEGYLEPDTSGEYRFQLYYAGYISVSIDGNNVVPERWRTAWNPNSWNFRYDMEKGHRYHLVIDWRPDGSTSYCGLTAHEPKDSIDVNRMTIWNEMVPQSDYYFISGGSMDNVLRGLHSLVGKPNVMPKWAMGYWQSREHYRTQDEIVSTLAEFRDRGIGIDNIVQDWNYWREDDWGSHEFDSLRYPDPQAMVDSIHALNGQIMISVWPKFYASTEHYREFDAQGWMYRRAVEDSIRDWVGPGYIGSFYDAYSDGARKLFWKQLDEHLNCYGIDAWWMDASEPNIRDCVPMDYQEALCGPTALGSSTQYLMAYSLMNAKAIYEGSIQADPDRRVFQLTRSGYPGLQRYSTASWSGDIASRWEDMRSQISAGMSYSLCGDPYWTMDIGGFCVENRYVRAMQRAGYGRFANMPNPDLDEWRELQTRWYQFGAFCPLFRSHGQFPNREPWNIAPEDHPAYQSIVYYNNLRYVLMPYIYSLAGRAWRNSTAIMRGLVMDYPTDAVARNISDQFLLGPSIMVCPVCEYGARSRSVYLPSGRYWYDFYDNTAYNGGQFIDADAPYERIPLFVPSGSIIVSGPEIQYVDQVPADTLTLDVYAGSSGRFLIYEDDGVTNNYEKGGYSTILVNYNENSDGATLNIGSRSGHYAGMLTDRVFNVRLHMPGMIVEHRIEYNGDNRSWTFNYENYEDGL